MMVITRTMPGSKLAEILNIDKDEIARLIQDYEKTYRSFYWLIQFKLENQNHPKPTVSEGDSPTKYRIT